ncbi:hypothetical protein D3C74_54410 [compost metagenome]
MHINIMHPLTKEKIRIFAIEDVKYSVLEVSPSKMTSNSNVRWLVAEFSRLFTPMHKRFSMAGSTLCYEPDMKIWWEVLVRPNQIRFFVVIPDKDHVKQSLTRQVMKTWKQANVREVSDYMPSFVPETTYMSKMHLKHHALLSLDTQNPTFSSLESLLNAKYYLKEDDVALLQIGMKPIGSGWNESASNLLDKIRDGAAIPRKKGHVFTKGDILRNILYGIGLLAEELTNLLGDFLIPGWAPDKGMSEALKGRNGEIESTSTRAKTRSEGFATEIRIAAQSEEEDRRKSVVRAIVSGFDPLEGDNRLIEKPVPPAKMPKELNRVMNRTMTLRVNGDVLCSLELSKIVTVPDQKAQIEHYNELNIVSHRGESEVPKDIFIDDGGIPFGTYEDTDGHHKQVYFSASNKNLLCMPRVVIGEPGTGKTSFAVGESLDSFHRGYGGVVVDAADGKLVQRILNRVPTHLRHKVHIIDFTNTENPIGLGWNEIFRGNNTDIIEDLVVEEILSYIEMISGTALNMRSRQWVENAVKATFTTPDATLLDVENMLNNPSYREKVIPTLTDPELRSDWEYYHNKLKPDERKVIYDEAWRRLAPIMRKKTLKNFILQRPKKAEDGSYLLDFRKMMDEGCLVLVKANETLGENLQTALVSFVIAKLNLAMITREDIVSEDDRHPCFLRLDEPDHYIKGSERWRNMLTRFRKYRCGLNMYFHGWQQLKEADKDLPKIIRKAGPHYIVFQTDEDNLLELKSVVEPEFKITELSKGMPQYHAVVRLKMYDGKGDTLPAFMVKGLDIVENRYPKFNNDDLYALSAETLGRPKQEVMEEIYRAKTSSEFDASILTTEISTDGDGDLVDQDDGDVSEEELAEERRRTKLVIEHEVAKYLEAQIERGEEPDEDLILEMDDLLEEG